jgi:hypothetical protein
MKKLLIGTALCALFAASAVAQPISMSDAQMDGISAGYRSPSVTVGLSILK